LSGDRPYRPLADYVSRRCKNRPVVHLKAHKNDIHLTACHFN